MVVFLLNLIGLLAFVVSVFYWNRAAYAVVGLFSTRRFSPAKRHHKYAVLVAARNEEKVIGNLIESVSRQDYPQGLVDVFVVADNCTDGTARAATQAGAVCYERFDTKHQTKGYALQFLVDRIRRDHGIDSYDGYFVFDADNLLKRDYISKMNDAFDAGEKIVTSYRNSKNFDANWIAASYGIHWLRTARMEHRARSLVRSAARIQGTGFLFSWELIQDGWKYTSLTEDRAFGADAVVNGYRISYQDQAEFYDEQPEALRIALRQRLRWAKGHLMSVFESGGKLLSHIFIPHDDLGATLPRPWYQKLADSLHKRYVSADMLSVVYPKGLMGFLRRSCVYLLRLCLVLCTGYQVVSIGLASGGVARLAGMVGWDPIPGSVWEAVALLTLLSLLATVMGMISRILQAAFIMLVERKRIMPIPWYKKLWFCLMFPLFDIIGTLSSVAALFTRVEWKPIPHKAALAMEELEARQGR